MSAVTTNHAVIEGIINLAVGFNPDIQWVDEAWSIDTVSSIIRADQLAVPILTSIENQEVRSRVAVVAQAAIATSQAQQSVWPTVNPARKATALLEMGAAVNTVIRRLVITEESLKDLVTNFTVQILTSASESSNEAPKLLLTYLCAMHLSQQAQQVVPPKLDEDRTLSAFQRALLDCISLLTGSVPEMEPFAKLIEAHWASCQSSADFSKLARALFPESKPIEEEDNDDKGASQEPPSTPAQPNEATQGGAGEGASNQDQQASTPSDQGCPPAEASPGGDDNQDSVTESAAQSMQQTTPESDGQSDKGSSSDSPGSKPGDESKPETQSPAGQTQLANSEDVAAEQPKAQEPAVLVAALAGEGVEDDAQTGEPCSVFVPGSGDEAVQDDQADIGLSFGAGGPNIAVPLPPAGKGLHSAVDGRLIMAMQKALQDKKIRNVGLAQSGTRVDATRVWRLSSLGDSRIFRKPAPRAGISAAVSVLMDRSSSMEKIIKLACRVTLALAEGLKRVPGTKTAIDLFPGYSRGSANLLPFGGQLSRARDRVGSVQAHGSTPLAEAVRSVMPELLAQKTERKILLIVSDGRPNDVAAASAAIKASIEEGIEVLGIGLGEKGVYLTQLVQQCSTVMSIEELPEAFAKLFASQILKA